MDDGSVEIPPWMAERGADSTATPDSGTASAPISPRRLITAWEEDYRSTVTPPHAPRGLRLLGRRLPRDARRHWR